ncbi:DUF3168 domain-containing protein [Neobacillus sedimentimangrovi]|uniref:DUF3168 domain-containing protein n=1 Tax=Neobacillus sedimentimangrovi TaxID=2699460 RepID=A0ABS8QLN6_9BACI|nr:DUF3168 domain-containing protein [Neobacillus sedimentimangrovi]MCD4839731.1 DUF3168 domain-containing protein [Neobacillus sedimentimangrovi]
MAIASLELQKTVFALLSENYPVYEVVPPNTPMPYITIGEEILTTSNTKTHMRTVHNITIHTWSKGKSSATSKIMNDYVVQTLLKGFLVNGFYLDKITLEMLTTFKEEATDGTIFHGVLQFEIILTN